MRIKTTLVALSLSLALAGGAVATLRASMPATETDASVWIQNPTIYFVPSAAWAEGAKSFKMVCYDNATFKGNVFANVAESIKFNGRDIYKFTVTENWYISKVQFCSFSDTEHEAEIYYSGDIALPDNFASGKVDTVVMDEDFAPANENAWTLATTSTDGTNTYGVSWIDTGKEVILKNFECNTPSSTTTRVFVHNSGTHWADGNGETVIRAWGGAADKALWNKAEATVNTVYNLTWFQDDNETYYGYADLPMDVTAFQLSKYSAANDRCATVKANDYYSQNLWFGENGFQNSIIYTASEGNTVTKGGAKNDVCGANLMKKVISAIDTCSTNAYNGYWAYDKVYTNFYSHKTEAVDDATVVSLGGSEQTIKYHMDYLNARKTAASPISASTIERGLAERGNSMAIALIVGLTVVTVGVVCFFAMRKKKEE